MAAERVGQDVRDYLQVMQIQGPWRTGHRLLVAVSPSPLSAQMVRWTRRLADSLDARWMAVHVESAKALSEADQARLTKNLALARDLGAEVIATADEDIVRGVLRVARQHNATQIVVGKPAGKGFLQAFSGGRLLRRLVEESGDIDIHVVRAEKSEVPKQPVLFRLPTAVAWKQYLVGSGIVIAVTILNKLLNAYLSCWIPGGGIGSPVGCSHPRVICGARSGFMERGVERDALELLFPSAGGNLLDNDLRGCAHVRNLLRRGRGDGTIDCAFPPKRKPERRMGRRDAPPLFII